MTAAAALQQVQSPTHRRDGETRLPEVSTSLHAPDVLKKLDDAARRGKLAGFRPLGQRSFEAEAFAMPFEHVLIGTITPAVRASSSDNVSSGTDSGVRESTGSSIHFVTRMPWRMPTIWLIVLLVTIWPGLPLTELLIDMVFPAGWWEYTKYWYLPMSIISLPLTMWWGFKKSSAMARASAGEMIEKVDSALHR